MINFSNDINFLKPKISFDFNNLNIAQKYSIDIKALLGINYSISKNEFDIFFNKESLLYFLLNYFNLSDSIIYSPADLIYKKSSSKFGYNLRVINRFEGISFSIKSKSLVLFENPSSIEGKYYDIHDLLSYWKAMKCTVVIDESFLDFSNNKSASSYIKEYDNLYIIKSFGNFYSCGEITDTLLISNEQNISKMQNYIPKNSISLFDKFYINSMLEDKFFKNIAKSVNIKNREELNNILENSEHIDTVYKSCTNFVLAKLKSYEADEFVVKLQNMGILIVDCSKYDFLDNSYIKISVKSTQDLQKLKETLNSIC